MLSELFTIVVIRESGLTIIELELELELLFTGITGVRTANQSIMQLVNARFVGRRYTTRPGASAIVSCKHFSISIKKYILESFPECRPTRISIDGVDSLNVMSCSVPLPVL